MECSWRLWPTPGMYAVTSTPLVRRPRATLRSAEFGFLGVVVYTRVHTPRRWGAPRRAGVLVLTVLCSRPFRTSCAIVGNLTSRCVNSPRRLQRAHGARRTRPGGAVIHGS